jgi:ribosomal protein L40E
LKLTTATLAKSRFCFRCGATLPDLALFCVECGVRQEKRAVKDKRVTIRYELPTLPSTGFLGFRIMIFTGYLAFGCIVLLVLVVGGLFLVAGWWMIATGFEFGIVALGTWFVILLFFTALYLDFIGSMIRWTINMILGMTRTFHRGTNP